MKLVFRDTKPPLERVILEFSFEEEFQLKLSKAAELSKQLDPYNQEPNLVLLPRLIQGQRIDFPPMGYLKFSDEKNMNWIEIGKDLFKFTFKEYPSWSVLIEKLIEKFFILKDILGFKSLKELYITYIDKFTIPSDGFLFEKYFSVALTKPSNWKIYPHDIFIGITPFEEDNGEKIIIRLRTPPNVQKDADNYEFRLETVFLNRNLAVPLEKEELKDYLTSAHDQINKYFVEFLTPEHHKFIGLEIYE